ncbi:flagellar export protein FliJ [Nitrococcus mobilis]|uniref:Flagellar FliJ protein n=1 Tax=Nitrococcus mobilis Nb-231 TaxID=314278 RepID=A4BUE0_9GAMM|nr:flagellar export protein FliJ [Nitrococcus mobilis]EAR20654.1 flagellar protein [Nitrococcus mobilis Nb-231]
MKRSKRMEPIHHLASARATELAQAYAAQRELLDQEGERMAQLRGFRREYEQKLTVSGGQGIDAYRLRDYNAFLARIDQAIGHQQQSLTHLAAEVEELRRTWLDQWGNARALEQLVARYRRTEQRADAVREQRLNDALAQRRSRQGERR